MSESHCKRGADRVFAKRKKSLSAAATPRPGAADLVAPKDAPLSTCAEVQRQFLTTREKRLINLERRARFQRLGGSVR